MNKISDYFINNIFEASSKLDKMVNQQRSSKKYLFHFGYARCHTFQKMKTYLTQSPFIVVPYSVFSLDLSTCDFGLFPTSKNIFKGMTFNKEKELLDRLMIYSFINRITFGSQFSMNRLKDAKRKLLLINVFYFICFFYLKLFIWVSWNFPNIRYILYYEINFKLKPVQYKSWLHLQIKSHKWKYPKKHEKFDICFEMNSISSTCNANLSSTLVWLETTNTYS